MKYILILLLLLSGCSPVKDSNESPLPTPSAPSPTPTEITNNEVAQTPIPTEEVVVTTTPSPSTNDDANNAEAKFTKTDIKGLFSVDILDPLPSQMEFSISASDDLTSGDISFDIHSSNPSCSPIY